MRSVKQSSQKYSGKHLFPVHRRRRGEASAVTHASCGCGFGGEPPPFFGALL